MTSCLSSPSARTALNVRQSGFAGFADPISLRCRLGRGRSDNYTPPQFGGPVADLFADIPPAEPRNTTTELTVELLRAEATRFSEIESSHPEPSLYGVSDGKAIGTYLEHKFRTYLTEKLYSYKIGNAANGLDFPGLDVDIKVTSVKQPQSSCPFRSIRQKVYGLGYSLLVFVYDKADDAETKTAVLKMVSTVFVERDQTADYTMTFGIRKIVADARAAGDSADVTKQELMAHMEARSLTSEEHELRALADAIMEKLPEQGYLTISPALQWRLQYKRVMEKAGTVDGVISVYKTQPLANSTL